MSSDCDNWQKLPSYLRIDHSLDQAFTVQERERQVQAVVATILSRMCAEPLHGPRIVLLLQKLLPPSHITAIQVYE